MKEEKYTLVMDNSELEKSQKNIYFEDEYVTISYKNKNMPKIKAKLSGRISIIETFEKKKIALDQISIIYKSPKKISEEIISIVNSIEKEKIMQIIL